MFKFFFYNVINAFFFVEFFHLLYCYSLALNIKNGFFAIVVRIILDVMIHAFVYRSKSFGIIKHLTTKQIIVNDASPEQIKNIVNQFPDKRVRYEENKTNSGGKDLVANYNHCIQFAQNDYIILATDDDMFDPKFLESATQIIKKHPSVVLV